MDDILCDHIRRSRLCTEDKADRPSRFLSFLNLQVFMDNVKRIHLLTLILMHTFDLDIKDALRIQFHTFRFFDICTEFQFLLLLDRFDALQDFCIVFVRKQFLQFIGILFETVTDQRSDAVGQIMIAGQ